MDLEESNRFAENQEMNEKKKKIVLVSIVLCMFLIVLLIILIAYIKYLDSLELKLFVDEKQQKISSTLLTSVDGTNYANVKEFAELFGYTYTKGEYEKYNEDETSCYLSNNYEVVAITSDKDTFTKYIEVKEEANGTKKTPEELPFGAEITVQSENGKSNTFTLEHPIKFVDGEIYIPFDNLTDVYNVYVDTSTENRIRITTLPNLFKSVSKTVAEAGYNTISGVYENIRAIPYGLVVVGNDNLYGVIDLAQKGKEILSVKYENLEFIQNSQEFFMSADSTVGLLDRNGKTIIKPMEYDEISVLDEVKQLYLVKKDDKYGVLNRNGDIIVHVDYERIGLKDVESFGPNVENVRNPNLLFDECIVVTMDSKYGMYDLTGKELLKTNYEAFGYKTDSTTDVAGEASLLIIPEETGIKGIVVCYDGLYGIYDVNAKNLIIPCACTRIYSITRAGKTNYYMEFGEEQIDLDKYLTDNNLKNQKAQNVTRDTEEVVVNSNNEVQESTENVENVPQNGGDVVETVVESNETVEVVQ